MPMIEYYAECNKNTEEVNILRFPLANGQPSDRPIPRPFYRIENEWKIARELRRVMLDMTLGTAQYINAAGELVAAKYTYEEIKGRTPSQADASVRHEKGELIIVSRDFAEEHRQQSAIAAARAAQPASAVNAAANNPVVARDLDSKITKEQEDSAHASAASKTVMTTAPAQNQSGVYFAAAAAALPPIVPKVVEASDAAKGIHFQLSTDAFDNAQPAQNAHATSSAAAKPIQASKPNT
jgi:hypothetical protein